MSNKITYLGILLTILIMSCVKSVSIAQETSSQPPVINPEIATVHVADCNVILNYQKLFTNHNNASKETVNDIKQTINDIAADRNCLNHYQNKTYASVNNLEPVIESSLETKK